MEEIRISQALQKAQEYEKEACPNIPKNQKPSFHVSAPVGWINDPNGFSLYQKEYHLFYQYHPYDTKWGPMHWGHSKTKDFIKWEQLPAALAPDMEYDGQGCFSGSAVEHQGRHILMYTSVLEKEQQGEKIIRQTQSIAVGDGIHYKKAACNPVITEELLPKESSKEDFRDPKMWWDETTHKFYVVVGNRTQDGGGQIVLFSSEDAEHWKREGIVDSSHNQYGTMWECPDLFALDDQWVLVLSPQEMEADGLEFHNGNNTMYIIGSFEKESVRLKRTKIAAIDYGLDFYAPQTVKTADGRRVMIGWMQSWDNPITPNEFNWSGIMSLPRELHIKDNRLLQTPVRELEQYHANPVKYEKVALQSETNLAGLSGRQIDMTIDIEGTPQSYMEIALACDDRYKTTLFYNAKENTLTFDRTHAGIRRDIIHQRTIKLDDRQGIIKLRIIMDRYTVEVFANDGEQAMSSLIYTPLEAEGIRFSGSEDVRFDVVKYDVVIE